MRQNVHVLNVLIYKAEQNGKQRVWICWKYEESKSILT